jgi:hypothetical protein
MTAGRWLDESILWAHQARRLAMKRRLYFLFPDSGHARTVVNELEAQGIQRKFIHAIAGQGGDLSGLPAASRLQQQDLGSRLERFLWGSNLIVFFAALFVMVVMVLLHIGWYWLLLPVGLMLASFLMGLEFVTHIPNVHLAEFRDAMQHREILLMIDVSAGQVAKVEELVHRHHPEAVTGGVGWNVEALQL